jgi:glycine/D-amino acid oxidase-like deaminating enzyme
MRERYDRIIIGGGIYGMYAALVCTERGERVLVLEYDAKPFSRATFVNQARVHMGYHYPRSLSTAVKSAGYYRRFVEDYHFCLNGDFQQVYATSSAFSYTAAAEFLKFCKDAGIPCRELAPSSYFREGLCDGAFLAEECAFDAKMLGVYFEDALAKIRADLLTQRYDDRIRHIEDEQETYLVRVDCRGESLEARAPYVLNATYASVNQILSLAEIDPFAVKYELCEIILVRPAPAWDGLGITVMDGPFFSVMPFGRTGLHSLTAVTFTPHVTAHGALPDFACMKESGGACTPAQFANCDACSVRPQTAYPFMSGLARKYLKEEYGFEYARSHFSVKPILASSEIDDSRPTVVKVFSRDPDFVSVLSGKINTVYDLNDELMREA